MSKTEKILQNLSNQRKWFNFDFSNEVPEVLIYDQIGATFWGEGLTPKDFNKQISDLEKTHTEINIRINSPGGFIHDGLAIYNHLSQSPLKKNVYIDGLAASAASFVAMAGDKIYMPESAEMMIHDPWAMVVGGADDMRKEAAHMDSLKTIIANIYAKKTGIATEDIQTMMTSECWMDGKQAKEKGFCDELIESKCAACVFDLDADLLPGLPCGFVKLQNAIKKRALENAYRDDGLSQTEAKKKLSAQNQRDAEEAQKTLIHTQAINLFKKELAICLTK